MLKNLPVEGQINAEKLKMHKISWCGLSSQYIAKNFGQKVDSSYSTYDS